MSTVYKFGGTSLATLDGVGQVGKILASDPGQRFAIVSAPGICSADDQKVTDRLRACVRLRRGGVAFADALELVFARYFELTDRDDLASELVSWCGDIARDAHAQDTAGNFIFNDDWLESRGEYLMARLLARILDWPFIDAAELVFFDKNGFCEPLSYDQIFMTLKDLQCAVVPGYYGTLLADGSTKVFPRGGSDISGAGIARGIHADVYKNFTDVDGILSADPRIVKKPATIRELTPDEARELCYAGANVLHADALLPVMEANIPTYVLNTFDPKGPSTKITSNAKHRPGSVVGIAGKKGFTAITIARSSMNDQVGFTLKVLQILKDLNVAYDLQPGGLDSITSIIDDQKIGDTLPLIVERVQKLDNRIHIVVKKDLAMITIVGEGMVCARGSAAAIFAALKDADINVSTISQGADEMVIIIGVVGADYESAIRAIYERCVERD